MDRHGDGLLLGFYSKLFADTYYCFCKQWFRFVSGTFENFGFAESENPNGLSGVYVSLDSSLDRLSGSKGGYIALGAIVMDKHIESMVNF